MKNSIPDVKIILFGSRVRGNALKTSGIDLIIISKVFETMHFTDRASYVLKILWKNKALPRADVDMFYAIHQTNLRRRKKK